MVLDCINLIYFCLALPCLAFLFVYLFIVPLQFDPEDFTNTYLFPGSSRKAAFETLGLPGYHATQEEIKQAFHALALKYHPDKNLDDPVAAQHRMAQINQAYRLLSRRSKNHQDL
jgi:hypothetical protein